MELKWMFGVPVIIHDETLDRTTNGHESVGDYTLDELKIRTKSMPRVQDLKPDDLEGVEHLKLKIDKKWGYLKIYFEITLY